MIVAVLDVNSLISAVLAPLGNPRQVLEAWQAGRFTHRTAEGIVTEVEQKLRLPRIRNRYGLSEDDVAAVIALLRGQAEFVTVPPHECMPVTGDPEDDYVLATCRLARADYLVTRDRGLLDLREHGGVRIVSPRDFLEQLQGTSPTAGA